MTGSANRLLRWMAGAAALCAVMSVPVVWEASQSTLSPDGTSYLDMATAALQSPGVLLKNGYWSPGYPALLAVMMAVLRPSPAAELHATFTLHWVIFLSALGSFTLLLRTVMQCLRNSWPEFIAFAYSLFLVANLRPTVWYITPDMLVQALVYAAAAFALKLLMPAASWKHAVGLGVILGAGYLTKAAVFPVALMLLAILFLRSHDRAARWNILLAAACFCLVAAPLVLSLSLEKHRFTFGDTGKLNYAWSVGGLPPYAGWIGHPPENGSPIHPPHIVGEAPLILEFRGPLPGTLPIWYDASYWWDGLKTPFSMSRQIATFLATFTEAPSIQPLLFALAALLLPLSLLSSRVRSEVRSGGQQIWILLVWPASACLMYSLVVFHWRYIVAYIVMLGLGAATLFLQPLAAATRVRSLSAATILLALVCAVRLQSIALRALHPDTGAQSISQDAQDTAASSNAVAETLHRMGIRPGDEISQLGYSLDCYYARRAGVRIVAQIWENPDEYVNLAAPQVEQILAKLKQLGIKALVSRNRAGFVNDQGWIYVPGTDVYIRPL
ncbi:MAG: hypothetical protein ABI806_26335 [Candidatus Solibacter sp.]